MTKTKSAKVINKNNQSDILDDNLSNDYDEETDNKFAELNSMSFMDKVE